MTAATAVFILAQFADILLTIYGTRSGAVELNPLGYGPNMIGLKLAATVLVAGLLAYNRRRLRWLIWIPGAIMYVVVIWNVINIVV